MCVYIRTCHNECIAYSIQSVCGLKLSCVIILLLRVSGVVSFARYSQCHQRTVTNFIKASTVNV